MGFNRPDFSSDLRDCLRFWSRLPAGQSPDVPDLTQSVRALPVAGLVIATPAILAMVIAQVLALPPLVAATSTIAVLVATTGALHEDGLADTADGLFGGGTPARRLEIMRDSRIGTFGTLALIVSVAARVFALAALLALSVPLAATALLTSAAISRVAGLLPLVSLPPARANGLGSSFGTPDRNTLRSAVLIAGATLILPMLAGVTPSRTLLAASLASAAAYALVPLARAKIGGQTGDIAGAAQQMAEIVCLGVLSGAAA